MPRDATKRCLSGASRPEVTNLSKKIKPEHLPELCLEFAFELPMEWSIGDVWELLDKARLEGAVIVIKLDGERPGKQFTVSLSGGKMGINEYLRKDSPTVEQALSQVLGEYAERAWINE